MVQKLINAKFPVNLSHSSVCRLLNERGLSAQRPLWRPRQQDPQAVERWKREEYPRIRQRARRRGAQIFFSDEAGVRRTFTAAPCRAGAARHRWFPAPGPGSARKFSAVSARGEPRFIPTNGRISAGVFIEFLKRLLVNAQGPIFLVVDGHPAHKAERVQRFVADQQGRLELCFLPPYSPQLKPDEFVWNDLKNNGHGRRALASAAELRQVTVSHLRRTQKPSRSIASFLQAPTTRYAATT